MINPSGTTRPSFQFRSSFVGGDGHPDCRVRSRLLRRSNILESLNSANLNLTYTDYNAQEVKFHSTGKSLAILTQLKIAHTAHLTYMYWFVKISEISPTLGNILRTISVRNHMQPSILVHFFFFSPKVSGI